ncbi:MAG: 50S ribosomal protein L23 [Endomicrobium sp.]|jgi:large subunit ribosomal protein L23|nr:50S ribosomal protein L23 [Endomicrobium sp.]
MDIRNVIIKPIVTEKTTFLKKNNKYVFSVNKNANKFQIKLAVETLFNVNVENVCTLNYTGKSKRSMKSNNIGHKNDWKKAIVKIKKDQEIKIVDEI